MTTFIRFGGLSKVNYKKALKANVTPAKKGIYAFIYPYIEDFLWVWKLDDKIMSEFTGEIKPRSFNIEYKRIRKKFEYEGFLWTHFTEEARKYGFGVKYKNGWVKIHTNDLNFIFNKVKHADAKQLMSSSKEIVINPYKRCQNGNMSRDHLEVFIEKVN